MNAAYLIAENSEYLRMLQMHPGVTIYQSIAEHQRYQTVASVMINRSQFIDRQPAFITSILDRMEAKYQHFQAYEKPVIRNLAGNYTPWAYSAAGQNQIDILSMYRAIEKSLEENQPMVQTRA